jgi:hypothetical protein
VWSSSATRRFDSCTLLVRGEALPLPVVSSNEAVALRQHGFPCFPAANSETIGGAVVFGSGR